MNITVGNAFKEGYKDEYTGELLPQKLVEQAMIHEMQYFNKMVWELVSKDEAAKIPGSKVIGGRWVLCNKGDLQSPTIPCRWVATEVNTGDDLAYYAATPPLEA